MTKAERLLYLVNMIRNRGVVLVRDMAGECNVSQRTIYRDINSLARLNFPVYYDNGYRFARDTCFPTAGLDQADVELVCYALRNNPLVGHPFFNQRYRAIEHHIQARIGPHRQLGHEGCFLFDKRHRSLTKTHESEIIRQFLRAIRERRKVAVVPGDKRRRKGSYVPLAVKVGRFGTCLMLANESKLLQETPVRNVESIRLLDDKFTQRPLYLLKGQRGVRKSVDDVRRM